MEQTALLKLPYIMPSQAQKHVTHNEAVRALDVLVFLTVSSRQLSSPPAEPAEGERLIVATPASQAFTGEENKIAAFVDGGWIFFSPREGWLCWCGDEEQLLVYSENSWVETGARSGGIQSLPALGINATADEANKFAVASDASLFNNSGSGHQMKINKALAADTGSVLYQTGWSGRAETGLAGSDDFTIKVSPDGANWETALKAIAENGAVRIDSLAMGTNIPQSEFHLASERASGLAPHFFIRSGKNPGSASCVAYQRATASQQMLFAFETGSSSNPDGYMGTFPNKEDAIYILSGNGAGSKAAIGVDVDAGLRIGTASSIVSGAVGAEISSAGSAYFATEIGIGANADASAALHVESTARGFLPPRMTTAQRDAISSPSTGLIIYNLTANVPQYWNGTAWQDMG